MKTSPRKLDVQWLIDNIVFPLKISNLTKIASMGSCFAREIKKYLVSNNYNYMQVEHDKRPWLMDDPSPCYVHASAAWERVYNIFTLQNILEYSLEGKEFDRLNDCGAYCVDLLRTRLAYPNRMAAETDIIDHVEKSAFVLKNCDVFIFTLGLVEVWKLGELVLACSPLHYSTYKPRGNFTYHITGYEENYGSLCQSVELLQKHNPNIKIILSVSPVHLCATHREDVDVLSASCYSKSVLRTVVNDVINKYERVYYFPSYEIATVGCNMMGRATYSDGHHINPDVIADIMKIFNIKCMEG